jgi:hypothetical protein
LEGSHHLFGGQSALGREDRPKVFAREGVASVKDPLELKKVFARFMHLKLLGMPRTTPNGSGSSLACEKA